MTVSWPFLALIGVLAATVAVGVLARREVTDFLATVPALESESDLDEFKRVAGRNMWAALVMAGVSVSSAGLGVTAYMLGWMGRVEGLVAMAAWGAALLPTGVWVKRAEARMWTMPAAEDLEEERDRVVRVWKTGLFPNWDSPSKWD